MDAAIILTRIVQYLAAAALFGTPLFLTYALPREGPGGAASLRWPRPLIVAAALTSLGGAVAYLLAQTAQMAGDPAAAADAGMLGDVLTGMALGRAGLARIVAAAFAAVLAAVVRPGRGLWLATSALGALVLTSFAWNGHGAADEGTTGFVHLVADMLHLLAAGVWVGALFAFALLLTTRRPTAQEAVALHKAVAGFAGVGSAAVAILVASGLVNSWILVGPTHLNRLFDTPYGLVLLAKLAAFASMAGLAARNRLRHTPALGKALPAGPLDPALAALRRSVFVETALGIAVLALVGVLGMLAPISSE
jgi:putative copper resistance protein D